MDLVFLLFLPCVLWKMRYSRDGFHPDFLGVSSTQSLRGILAVLVLFYHLCQKLQGVRVLFFIDNIGIMCVATFFFLSGYGLQKSYSEKPNYRSTILSRRIPAILVPYLLLTALYWAYHALTGNTLSLVDLWRLLAEGAPIVDYSWYSVVILLIYLNYYLSTFLFRPGHWGMVAYHALSIALWMLLCRSIGFAFHWYHTVMAFVVGIFWAMEGERINARMQKHYLPSLLISLVVFLLCYAAALKTATIEEVIVTLFWAACCTFLPLLLLILMKFAVRNPVLHFLGNISFELYGLQGLFIRLFRGELCYIENDTVWCVTVIAVSVACSWLLHSLLAKILSPKKRIAA